MACIIASTYADRIWTEFSIVFWRTLSDLTLWWLGVDGCRCVGVYRCRCVGVSICKVHLARRKMMDLLC